MHLRLSIVMLFALFVGMSSTWACRLTARLWPTPYAICRQSGLSKCIPCDSQALSIRRATELHPGVFIFLIADDTHVVSKPEDVVPAILTIRHLYSQIGLSLAATTEHKNVIYGVWEVAVATAAVNSQSETIIAINGFVLTSASRLHCDITAHTVLLYVLFSLTYMYCTLYH